MGRIEFWLVFIISVCIIKMSSKQQMLSLLCVLAMALQITAISTSYWSDKSGQYNGLSGDAHMGLWKACVSGSGTYSGVSASMDGCIDTPPSETISPKFPKNSLHAVRAFAIMGVVFVFLASFGMMYMPSYRKSQLTLLIAGGLSSLIAGAIWAGELLKIDNMKMKPGYSFYLNLVGGLLALVASVCFYKNK